MKYTMKLIQLFVVLLAYLLSACAPLPTTTAPTASSAVVESSDRPAENALITGIRQYEETQYADAEAQLGKALTLGLSTPRHKALAHKYLAFMYCVSKRTQECEASFRQAIAADPNFALNKLEEGHPLWGPVAVAAARSSFPNKNLRLIVPFAPGGTTDIIARIVSEKLGGALGQAVIVDNRAGAGGINGALEAAQARPDGYTLSVATVSTLAANPAINPKIPYDPVNDFIPIINMAATPNVIAVHPSFPAKDFKGLLEVLSKNPGKYSYASSGTGGIGHLQMELFKTLTKTYVLHIPYRGGGPALADVAGGQVPIIFDNLPSALPYIKSGRLIPIVIAAPQRLAALPNVPTFKELGLEPINRMAFYGLLVPKSTSKDVVEKLNSATRSVLADGNIKRRIEETGSVVLGNTPEEFARQIQDELAVYRQVVRVQKLSLE
jgi:tripartite-type tricarboxylate transporter receptor subunit TctC